MIADSSAVLLGAGGHAGVLASILHQQGVRLIGATDMDCSRKGQPWHGTVILGTDDDLDLSPDDTFLVNGIGNRAKGANSGLIPRAGLFGRFVAKGYHFPVVQHSGAVVARDSHLKDGVQIMACAVVQSGSRIGQNTIVNSGAIIEHDCQIERHSHIAPGAILCGGVKIGNRVHIGAGAVILGGVEIGDDAVIPAGLVVRHSP